MIRSFPLALFLVACGPKEPDHQGFTTTHTGTGTEGHCEVLSETPLAVDEQVGDPMFFSAQDALDELTGVTNTTNVLEWPDGNSISVEVEFVYSGGAITHVERDNVGALTADELKRCFSAIEIEGDFTFVSGDGAFDEAFPGTLQAVKRRDGRFYAEIEEGSLGGTWTPDMSGITGADGALTLAWDGDITNLGSSGEITAVDASGARYPVATWAPPPTQGR